MISKESDFLNKEKSEKQKQWEEMALKIDQVVDKLGEHIDEDVKETIIGLNLFGINTAASCGGHLDRGSIIPWIDVESKSAAELEAKEEKAVSEEEKDKVIDEIRRENLMERKKLLEYLDEFYKNREVSANKRIIISGYGRGVSKLESQGASLQEIESDETKQKRLQEYQDEMKAFSDFLKKKFFSK